MDPLDIGLKMIRQAAARAGGNDATGLHTALIYAIPAGADEPGRNAALRVN